MTETDVPGSTDEILATGDGTARAEDFMSLENVANSSVLSTVVLVSSKRHVHLISDSL